MTPAEIIAYCLKKPGAYLDYPFGPNSTILKVRKRIFAQVFTLRGVDSLTLNCDRMNGEFYRTLYPDIVVRGYHCPPVQQPFFNTMPLNGVIEDAVLKEMIDHSYATVVKKLPKYLQKELLAQ